MATDVHDPDQRDNRRLGHRVRPDGMEVLWCLPGTVVGARREKKRPPAAQVIDLSVTGMQVLAPADKRVGSGTVIEVVIGGITTPVRIRWVGDCGAAGKLVYGVEMLRQGPNLTAYVNEVVAECDRREGVAVREAPVARMRAW